MSLFALRTVVRTVARSALAPLSRRSAPLAAPMAMMLQQQRPSVCVGAALAAPLQPRSLLHSLALRRSDHAADDAHGEHFHGHDFLSRENVERRVKMVLAEVDKIDKQKLNDPNSTFRDLGLDSLDEVEVVMMLEDEFVIDIQDEVASNIVSVQDAINYITQHPFAANDEVHH